MDGGGEEFSTVGCFYSGFVFSFGNEVQQAVLFPFVLLVGGRGNAFEKHEKTDVCFQQRDQHDGQ